MQSNILINTSNIFERLLPLCLSHDLRLYYGFPVKTTKGIFYFNRRQYFQSSNIALDIEEIKEDPYIIELSSKPPCCTFDQVIEIEDLQKCLQCKRLFKISENIYGSCEGDQENGLMEPCFHLFRNRKPGPNGPLTDFVSTEPTYRPPSVFALDTEMAYTSHGSELVRVSLVNIFKQVVFDYFVTPVGIIYSLHTQYSGVTSADLVHSMPFEEIRKIMLSIVKSQDIIIGHSLEQDLAVLKIRHQRVIDTSILDWEDGGIHKSHNKRKPSLKQLANMFLGIDIQSEVRRGHDSTEDALATLNLVLRFVGCF